MALWCRRHDRLPLDVWYDCPGCVERDKPLPAENYFSIGWLLGPSRTMSMGDYVEILRQRHLRAKKKGGSRW